MEFRTDKQTAITLIIHKAISLEDGFYVITFRVTATAKNYVRSNVWANTKRCAGRRESMIIITSVAM